MLLITTKAYLFAVNTSPHNETSHGPIYLGLSIDIISSEVSTKFLKVSVKIHPTSFKGEVWITTPWYGTKYNPGQELTCTNEVQCPHDS